MPQASPAIFDFLEITFGIVLNKGNMPEEVQAAIKGCQAALAAARGSMGQLAEALNTLSQALDAAKANGADINPGALKFPCLERQLSLFAVPSLDPRPRQTTAIYPNRQKEKAELEKATGLDEFGNETQEFYTSRGTLFAVGYSRIVYGDHGPYLEFRKDQIRCTLRGKFSRPCPPTAFYEWLCPTDGSGVKVYNQKKDVKHLKNPPAGGFRGNRAEGYADYRVGMIYVDPYSLRLESH